MSEIQSTCPVVAKKSFRDGHVGLGIRLKCSGWHGDSAKIEAGLDLTTAQARALAKSLTEAADAADAKAAAKAAAEERRRKYHDREIAAGRMVVLGRL